ncbi:hypothetical protein RFM23_21025 [Mesorhizobium abyssinicae]|uniref:Uncharacterized protein n=1 Tax=Mesorhizobium abyssinicae TaxID=1209958 RepID=A0ABU5AS25_9HYPH|nr:hypothetical protein [Mesorhizobium abyssinicae]MDX8540106.1 hypothetical protein [Mesorhizobium abyssinicae]
MFKGLKNRRFWQGLGLTIAAAGFCAYPSHAIERRAISLSCLYDGGVMVGHRGAKPIWHTIIVEQYTNDDGTPVLPDFTVGMDTVQIMQGLKRIVPGEEFKFQKVDIFIDGVHYDNTPFPLHYDKGDFTSLQYVVYIQDVLQKQEVFSNAVGQSDAPSRRMDGKHWIIAIDSYTGQISFGYLPTIAPKPGESIPFVETYRLGCER